MYRWYCCTVAIVERQIYLVPLLLLLLLLSLLLWNCYYAVKYIHILILFIWPIIHWLSSWDVFLVIRPFQLPEQKSFRPACIVRFTNAGVLFDTGVQPSLAWRHKPKKVSYRKLNIWGHCNSSPLECGRGCPPRNMLLSLLCHWAKFGHSRSDCTSVIFEICQKMLTSHSRPSKLSHSMSLELTPIDRPSATSTSY